MRLPRLRLPMLLPGRFVWLLSLTFLICSCQQCPSKKPNGQQVEQEPEVQKDLAVSNNVALVQVFLQGMSVFQFDGGLIAKPTAVNVYFPAKADHEKKLMYASPSGSGYQWNSSGHSISNQTIKFNGVTSLDLTALHTTATGNVPSSQDQARDVRWLLQSPRFGSISNFKPVGANTLLEIKLGVLETCALVFPVGPLPAPPAAPKICLVKTKNKDDEETDAEARATSEMMVLRFPADRNTFEVELQPASGASTLYRPPLRGGTKTVDFEGTTYTDIIDLLISNVERNPPGRSMRSDHPEHIRMAMFDSTTTDWQVEAPECSDNTGPWVCSCSGNWQPTCWEVLLYGNSPGSLNRPICPFIEYP